MKTLTKPKRISRLKTRKVELLVKIKALRANPGRNKEHKVEMLNDQVLRISGRIIKLRG